MFAGPRRFDGRIQSQQVGLARDLLDDRTRLAISFMAATASTTDLPLSCASVADLFAILSVCCALSAFCLMLETISSSKTTLPRPKPPARSRPSTLPPMSC